MSVSKKRVCATVSSACLSTCLVQLCLPKQLWLARASVQRVYPERYTGSVCMRRWAAALQTRIVSNQIRRNRQIQILSSDSHPAESDRCGSVLIFGPPEFPSRRLFTVGAVHWRPPTPATCRQSGYSPPPAIRLAAKSTHTQQQHQVFSCWLGLSALMAASPHVHVD